MEVFLSFVQDVLIDGAVAVIGLGATDMQRVADAMAQFNLDFDDAYQYVAAEKYNLTIVSFDTDFDRTGRGRRTPDEILRADGRA